MRIVASEETRKRRGWTFQPNVDDAESECGLDQVEKMDYTITNDGDKDPEELLKPLLEDVSRMMMPK